MLTSDGDYVCTACGRVAHRIVLESASDLDFRSGEHGNYQQRLKKGSLYKRDDHIRDFFGNLTALKVPNTEVDIFDNWDEHLERYKLTRETATPFHIRHILRERGLARYYEYVPIIMCNLHANNKPNMIPVDLKDMLISLCKKVESVYWECCDSDRKNFYNLHFVFHQLCGILGKGADKYQGLFRLPRTRSVLHKNVATWKRVCEKLDWPFISPRI